MELELIDIKEEFDPNIVKVANTFTYEKVGNIFPPLNISCTGSGNHNICDGCINHPKNGEARVCCCQFGAPKITC